MWSEYILRVSGHSFYHSSLRLKRKQSSLSQVPFSPLLALTAFEAPKMVPAVCLGLYTPHPNLHYESLAWVLPLEELEETHNSQVLCSIAKGNIQSPKSGLQRPKDQQHPLPSPLSAMGSAKVQGG